MNREQASAELAKRTGWQEIERNVQLEGRYVGYPPNKCEPAFLPDYFTDHAAARELVRWLVKQSAETWANFVGALIDPHVPVEMQEYMQWDDVAQIALLATSNEITCAICKALGIELDAA